MSALHRDEFPVDVDLVRRLVAASFPQYADLSLEALAPSGSSNALFRPGNELLVRLPRQPRGSATIEKEARWLPRLAAGLMTPVPGTVAVGSPGFGYPEKWALTRWLDGQALDLSDAAWTKSMGWALLIATITFPYYWQTMPSRCASRRTMAAAVLATAPLRG